MIAKAITAIWLVEDNEIFAKHMRRLIDTEDDMACPYHFTNAEDLFEKLKSTTECPDLLLCDIGLPGRDGLKILSEVRSLLPGLKVLMLTAFDDYERVYRAICNGASGYLLKTDEPDEMLAGIRVVMDGSTAMSNPIAKMILDRWREYRTSSTTPA
jgi:DNA-binding NarL/FixJ family response regulator